MFASLNSHSMENAIDNVEAPTNWPEPLELKQESWEWLLSCIDKSLTFEEAGQEEPWQSIKNL